MLPKEKSMKDKTFLEKIGISNKIIENWKRKGLKITFPMKRKAVFFKSFDGTIFIEGADKFVPPLTKEETKIYIKDPERFRKDFFENARFFRKFVNFVYKHQEKVKKLESKEKVAALLILIYLFHRAMDYHYFHWDRYLVYEDYPSTPVGYWLKKLKYLYSKAVRRKVSRFKPPEGFLKLIILDKGVLEKFRKCLSKNDFLRLKRALKMIKIFEDTQQKEIEFFIDFKSKEHAFVRTGFAMWSKLQNEIKKHPELIKKEKIVEIKKIMELHPLVGTRKLFSLTTLKYFDREIFSQFQKEIKRWL